MTQFVNYKKRSFTLPPGCKDLIEVIAPYRQNMKGRSTDVGLPYLEIKEDRFPTAGLAQVGRYVSMLLRARGELFTLSVTAQGFQFPVTLYRSRTAQIFEIVLVTKEPHQERAIRMFFEQRGLQAIMDDGDLDAPGAARGLAYPLPFDPARATILTTELLQSAYGLSKMAGLDFRYYETAA